jgi:hypothetical protein
LSQFRFDGWSVAATVRRGAGATRKSAADVGDDPREQEGGEKLADHRYLLIERIQREERASQPSAKATPTKARSVEVRWLSA